MSSVVAAFCHIHEYYWYDAYLKGKFTKRKDSEHPFLTVPLFLTRGNECQSRLLQLNKAKFLMHGKGLLPTQELVYRKITLIHTISNIMEK